MKQGLQIKLGEYNLIQSTIQIYAVADNAPNLDSDLNFLSSEEVTVTRIHRLNTSPEHRLILAVCDVKEQTKNFGNIRKNKVYCWPL